MCKYKRKMKILMREIQGERDSAGIFLRRRKILVKKKKARVI